MLLNLGKKLLCRVAMPPPLVIALTVAEMVLMAKDVYDKYQGQGGTEGNHGRADRN